MFIFKVVTSSEAELKLDRTLAKFYPIFWCGSLLYDKNWQFYDLLDVELFDDMDEEAIEEGPARRDI